MNIHYIKVRIVRTKYDNIKLINGEASSSTIVEELASHDKRNHKDKNNQEQHPEHISICLQWKNMIFIS